MEPIIKLEPPRFDKGITVMQALKNRRSERNFSDRRLSHQHLSEILAANGINREDGKRALSSAMNKHPVDVYAVLPEGVYLYDPSGINFCQLLKVTIEDLLENKTTYITHH